MTNNLLLSTSQLPITETMAGSTETIPGAPKNQSQRMPSLADAVLLNEGDLGKSRGDEDLNQITPTNLSYGRYRQARLECMTERENALCTYDLEEMHLKMPASVADVYNDHVKVKGRMGNLTQVRKLVRSVIFPKMKFVTIPNKSVQNDFLVGMNWDENNTDVDKALRWNTYSADVGKTLSKCRSSSICYMKRNLIPSKCSTLISFSTCYRIY
jgi:hypothetical protein